jgi:hypothetical protein
MAPPVQQPWIENGLLSSDCGSRLNANERSQVSGTLRNPGVNFPEQQQVHLFSPCRALNLALECLHFPSQFARSLDDESISTVVRHGTVRASLTACAAPAAAGAAPGYTQ